MTHNVDTQEIYNFNQLAERWWDPTGPMRPLHQLNPVRLSYITQHADVKDKRVLDIGCGAGLLTEALCQAGAQVTGIDMADQVIEIAQSHAADNGLSVTYERNTAEAYAEQHPGQYDVITCLEMLEHVPDPRSILNACKQLLKPGGHLFLSTLNRTPKSFLFAIVGAEYIAGLLPKGTHHYRDFIKPSELAAWVHETDLTVDHLQGLSYQFLKRAFHLSQDTGVNYLLHATNQADS